MHIGNDRINAQFEEKLTYLSIPVFENQMHHFAVEPTVLPIPTAINR